VAAAARGLLTGGADEVVVLDNHASGNPINIRAESLPARARLKTWDVFELRDRGVDALLQVGYHSRAGLDAFVPHTYVPELVLYLDGEPISESHGRAWAAGVPLLGICGNDVHGRTLGSLGDVAEDVARSPGVPAHSPKRAQLAAFVRAEPLYTLDIARWEDARQPIADAMAAAIASLYHPLRSDE
jgi:D-aminopeptidase